VNRNVGTITVKVRATDGKASASSTFQLTVVNNNDAPVVTRELVNASTNEDALYTLNAAAAFDDVDLGDTLTYSATNLPDGLAIDPVTGVISGTPTNAVVGSHTIVVTAKDAVGETASSEFVLIIVNTNDAPIARDDYLAAHDTGPTVLDWRDNDSDVDGDELTVLSWTTPIEGTVTRNPAGDLVFDPGDDFAALSAGQTATVQFTYTIADGHGGTDTAVATVTVRGEGTFTAPATADTETVVLPVNGQTATFGLEAPSRTTTTDAEVTLSVRFGTELQPPLNIIYLIDVSGSTDEDFDTGGTGMPVGDLNGDGRANTVLDAEIANLIDLTQKIRALGFSPEDVSVTLIPFSDDAAAGGGPRPNSFKLGGPGELNIQAYLKNLDSGGGTNFEAALGAAADALGVLDPTGAEQNHIYFLTDGDGTGSFGDELAALTGSFDARISAVGVGADAQLGMLDSIDNTGGAIQIRSGNALDVPVPAGRVEAVELFVGGREITGVTPGSFVNKGGVLTLSVVADELARYAGDTNVIEAHVTLTGNQTVSTSVTIGGALPRSTDLDL
jgi:Bacterial Ig domain